MIWIGTYKQNVNTTSAKRVEENVAMADKEIPSGFWKAMKAQGLLDYEGQRQTCPEEGDGRQFYSKRIIDRRNGYLIYENRRTPALLAI
jgi:hypothetical protein